MFDITCTIRTELWFHIYTKSLGETVVYIDEVFATTVRDVECLTSSRRRRKTCFEIGLYNVLNVSEVTRLFTIAIDMALLTINEKFEELRNNCCISSIRILTTTKDIEVAHAVGVKVVMLGILLSPLFVTTLADCIRTEKITFNTFFFRKVRFITIYRRRRCINKFFYAILASCFKHIESTLNIVERVKQWHLDGTRN